VCGARRGGNQRMSNTTNRRILLIDDTASIHDDFRKILLKKDSAAAKAVDDAMAALLNPAAVVASAPADPGSGEPFEIDSAFQGKEGTEKAKAAREGGMPFALAFVDIRMPPGWDGVRTIESIWQIDPDIQTVICTAYSDYSWEQMVSRLGRSDRLLVLKKPFDPVEISQLAIALTEKWNLARTGAELVEKLRRAEGEARAYASSLETVNHALVTAKAASDKMTEMKTEFLLRLSDEVNRNIKSILDDAGRLRDEDTASAKPVDAIIHASESLMATFNETLDFATIEAGKQASAPVRCEPIPLIEEICERHKNKAVQKGLDFRVVFQGEIPASIETDPNRLRQVLGELIDNAIQYTKKGGVTVSTQMQLTQDWQWPLLRCAVADTGCGISNDDRGKIFDPFPHRGAEGTKKKRVGIGLALAKKLADVLGGDIQVESDPGKGSVFALTIETGDLAGVPMVDATRAS
jgi:signal transduction histidine kinase